MEDLISDFVELEFDPGRLERRPNHVVVAHAHAADGHEKVARVERSGEFSARLFQVVARRVCDVHGRARHRRERRDHDAVRFRNGVGPDLTPRFAKLVARRDDRDARPSRDADGAAIDGRGEPELIRAEPRPDFERRRAANEIFPHIIREIPGVDGSSPARRRRGPAGDGQDGFGGPDL